MLVDLQGHYYKKTGVLLEEIHVPAHNRRKRGKKPLPDNLPGIERLHCIDGADKICVCGCELSQIGE